MLSFPHPPLSLKTLSLRDYIPHYINIIIYIHYYIRANNVCKMHKRASDNEKEGFKVNIFTGDDYCDAISHLLDEASLKCVLPTSYDLMGVIRNHYFNSEIYNCFDDDDMIDHLDGTYSMENYIDEKCEDRLRDERFNCENEADSIIKGHPDTVAKSLQELNSFDLKRFFCDFVDSGYCISNEELLNKLKEKICL